MIRNNGLTRERESLSANSTVKCDAKHSDVIHIIVSLLDVACLCRSGTRVLAGDVRGLSCATVDCGAPTAEYCFRSPMEILHVLDPSIPQRSGYVPRPVHREAHPRRPVGADETAGILNWRSFRDPFA